MLTEMDARAFDLDLAQAVHYTPCGKGHTHHLIDWPLSGTLTIDKCERQCRFPACKAWSQTAAALRKHVNAHILNNNLNLRIVPASNGREPMKIHSGNVSLRDSTSSRNASLHTLSPVPMPYTPRGPGSPSSEKSDYDCTSRRSSNQAAASVDYHWPPKRAPDTPESITSPKRARTDLFGEMHDLTWPANAHISPSEEPKSSEPAHQAKILMDQKLDSLMLKVQMLKDSTSKASLARREKLAFKPGSPLSPGNLVVHDLPSARIRSATAAQFRQLNKQEQERLGLRLQRSQMSPSDTSPPGTISPKMVSLAYHEQEAEQLSRVSTQLPDKLKGISPPSYSFFESPTVEYGRTPNTPENDNNHRLTAQSSDVQSLNVINSSLSEWTPTPEDQSSRYQVAEIGIIDHNFNLSKDVQQASTPNHHLYTEYRDERLQCLVCYKYVKTRSELKKHDLRHKKPFRCEVPHCARTEGFSTANDLTRHVRSRHPTNADGRYNCRFPGCRDSAKEYNRLDNFRSHLKRMHSTQLTEEGIEALVRGAQFDSAVADIVEFEKSQATGTGTGGDRGLDLQSLHVLADSAVLGQYAAKIKE